MDRHLGAWIRYGEPLTADQIAFAVDHYGVAILQPWEVDAAREMKSARSEITVLCYKCLSSSRSYERGPIFTSGVGYDEAEESGEEWFAHRLSGERIEWRQYPGHWQMAVWDAEYQDRWIENVVEEIADSPWDGVMADNDVFGDYYGIDPPIEGDRDMRDIRAALDELIQGAGARLRDAGKLLVPNIAEARRDPGRWERHAAFGGGFDEMWLGYEPDSYFDPETVLAQVQEIQGKGLAIVRVPTDGVDDHPNFLYGLATLWVFSAGNATIAATAHDDYSGTPFVPELDWDLGEPLEEPRRRGNGWSRAFTRGWAAVNLNQQQRRRVVYAVHGIGLEDRDGNPAPKKLSLSPHHGAVFRRAS